MGSHVPQTSFLAAARRCIKNTVNFLRAVLRSSWLKVLKGEKNRRRIPNLVSWVLSFFESWVLNLEFWSFLFFHLKYIWPSQWGLGSAMWEMSSLSSWGKDSRWRSQVQPQDTIILPTHPQAHYCKLNTIPSSILLPPAIWKPQKFFIQG